MNRTILYYPTIDIPKSSWLRHSLLYWDQVSSIVPRSWDDNFLINLSPEVHYLMDEGQFRPIKPEDLIYGRNNLQELADFEDEFMSVVSSSQFKNFTDRHRSKSFDIYMNRILPSKIHSNKTSDGLYQFLNEKGLATRDGHDEWINVERTTALLYMSLLAKYLADIDNNHTTIGTDYYMYEKFNFKRVNETNGFPVITFNLNNVLPTPVNNISFEKIIEFKRKRKDNLNHFKKTLSDFQTQISRSSTNGELKENAINFEDMLRNGVQDLTSVLKDHKIEYRTKSLKSLISIKSPTALLSAGAAINSKYNYLNLPLDLGVAGIATIGAIQIGFSYIESRNKVRAKLRESPFSYIYYAQDAGIVNYLR